MRKRSSYSWLFGLLLLLILAFIWGQSLQPGTISHGESRRVLALVRQLLGHNFLTDWLTDNKIRRLAHLTEYGTFGLVASLGAWHKWGRECKKYVLALGILIASLDETIQYFAGGRTATWHDVVVDAAGVMVGIVVVWLIYRWHPHSG